VAKTKCQCRSHVGNKIKQQQAHLIVKVSKSFTTIYRLREKDMNGISNALLCRRHIVVVRVSET
jgi:hypothetical protein